MTEEDREIEQYLSDAIMGRPQGFSIGERHFSLYPLTLGKMQILQRQIESLDINQQTLQENVSVEALRLAEEKQDVCLTIIAYHTCKNADEVFDNILVSERKALFKKEMSNEEIASLMLIVLSSDKTALFFKHLGIDKEQERMNTVMRIKNKGDKNNITFGGKSIYGTLIDAACERYGWTKEYVVWGIDFTSLRLMLADKVNSIYLTDEEAKKVPASVKNPRVETIKATKENMEDIKKMDWH